MITIFGDLKSRRTTHHSLAVLFFASNKNATPTFGMAFPDAIEVRC